MNIKSLKLINERRNDDSYVEQKLRKEDIIRLKQIVNLPNIKDPDLWLRFPMKSSIFLQILIETPQLSALTVGKSVLMSYLNNNELCIYLSPMMYELHIGSCSSDRYLKPNEIDLICQTFSNLKQLKCSIKEIDDVLLVLNSLPKMN